MKLKMANCFLPAAAVAAAVLLCCAATAPSPAPPTPTDREEILAVVLDFIEHKIVRPTPISTILVTGGLDQAARDAASRLRPVITRSDIPASSPYVTPPEHLVLSRLSLSNDTAVVEAGIGPVAKSAPGDMVL